MSEPNWTNRTMWTGKPVTQTDPDWQNRFLDCLAENRGMIAPAARTRGISDWQRITPDEHHDWLEQRDPMYQGFMPLVEKKGTIYPVHKMGEKKAAGTTPAAL